MQTFLPYPDFEKSAAVLDSKRLNKQVLECDQLLAALEGTTKAWANHPAANMWHGHEPALRLYRDTCLKERLRRGGKSRRGVLQEPEGWQEGREWKVAQVPSWFGDYAFHAIHRANLVRKGYSAEKLQSVGVSMYGYLWPEADASKSKFDVTYFHEKGMNKKIAQRLDLSRDKPWADYEYMAGPEKGTKKFRFYFRGLPSWGDVLLCQELVIT